MNKIKFTLLVAGFALALTFTLSCSGDGGDPPAAAISSSSSYELPILIPNPDPPAGVTAVTNSTSSISVGWGAVSGATGYYVYRSTSTVGTYERVGSSIFASYTDSNLTAGTTYYYRISGYNSGGEGSQSVYTIATTLPDAPTGVTAAVASSASTNAITISWYPVTGATGYRIYRSDASTYVGTSATTQYINTGLAAGITYDYQVTAYNSGGESEKSSVVSAITKPGIPTGLVATASSSASSITVSWEEVSGATGYNIYRNTTSSGAYTQVGTSKSASYTDVELAAVTTYYYKIAAYNSGGEGTQSSIISARTLLGVCAGELYDPSTQFCSGSTVYSLCGGSSYNPSTQFCSGSTAYSKCSDSSYDPSTQRCQNSVVQTKCGTIYWYDPSTQFCSGSAVYSLCGGSQYDPSTQFCSGSTAYSKCSGSSYDPSTQRCQNSVVQTKCGTINWYDPSTQFCQTGTNVVKNYGPPITDSRDGKTYKTVVIGTQTWMAENLNYYASGSKCASTPIGNANTATCDAYGRLYNWATAMDISSSYNSSSYNPSSSTKYCGVCPSGWHIPNNEEWNALLTAVGGASTAGTKLKAASGWYGNGNGTDDFGFAALPGGHGYSDGSFYGVGDAGYWWSATESNGFVDAYSGQSLSDAYAYGWHMHDDYDVYSSFRNDKTDLYSVRCVQD